MATFYLDPEDEITKAAALIRNSKETRLSIVVPPGSRVATSRMNFRLLAKEAQTRKRRLSIIAPDAASRALAASAGLPVFATVGEQEAAEAQSAAGGTVKPARTAGTQAGNGETAAALEELAATVETPRTPPPPVRRSAGPPARANLPREHRGLSLRAALVVLILIALVALAGTGAYLFLPSATVSLTPRAEPIAPIQLTVKIDPAAKTTDSTNLVVPGMAQNIPVQANGKFDATGQKVSETKASGIVTFSNANNDHGVQIAAGTQVWTNSGVVFLTHTAVTVPRATISGTTITPGTATVSVDAQRAGTSGNVSAGSIVNLPASVNAAVGGYLSVTNANPTAGGTHTVTPVVLQSDVDAAKGTLASQLQQQFVETIADPAKAPPSLKIFPDTSQLGAASFDPDPATLVGQAVDAASPKFGLAATATGTVTAADLGNVRKLADARLRANVPAGRSLVENSIAIDLGDGLAAGTIVNVPVSATAKTLPILDAATLKAAIIGKSQAEAKRYLSQYGEVELSMSPDWMPNLPGYDFRIDLRIVQPAPLPSPTPVASPTSPPSTASPIPTATPSAGAPS